MKDQEANGVVPDLAASPAEGIAVDDSTTDTDADASTGHSEATKAELRDEMNSIRALGENRSGADRSNGDTT